MPKKRTEPNKQQAHYLAEYFHSYLSKGTRWIGDMTDDQHRNALQELKQLHSYEESFPHDLYRWSISHINASTYSNAMRVANRKLKRLRGHSGYVPIRERYTTLSIKESTKFRLDRLKDMGDGQKSLDTVVNEVLDAYDSIKKLDRLSITIMVQAGTEREPTLSEIVEHLVEAYENRSVDY